VPSGADTVGLDSGTTGNLDSSVVDAEAIDTVVVLDADLDAEKLDVAKDGPADVAFNDVAPGNCLQQIVNNGYKASDQLACSSCQGSQNQSLQSQCTSMIDCLLAANCRDQDAGNCWVDCRNALSGDQISAGDCVQLIVATACPY